VDRAKRDESRILAHGEPLLAELTRHDNWLPDDFAQAGSSSYQQYLLYCDPYERFAVVSFVYGPDQCTPVYNLGVWGMIGVLRGAVTYATFSMAPDGSGLKPGELQRMEPGAVSVLSPSLGDIHRIANARPDGVSVTIHVFGANIATAKRRMYDPQTGEKKSFVSEYSNEEVPRITQSSLKVLLNEI
jgi:predicted metal-dependent enzyme (double-stranded beta helix superfamily)